MSFFEGGSWKSFSVVEIQQKVNAASHWLLKNGFVKGDCIAIVPRMGSPLWMVLDFACQQIGMITVPLHATLTVDEMKFILYETECKICVTADSTLLEKVKPVFRLNHLYNLDANNSKYFPGIREYTPPTTETTQLESIKKSIRPEDTLCIMYTSGTSGVLKGAVLSHYNVVCNIKSILPLFPLQPGHRILSFLPFSHVFERTSCYSYFAFGTSIFFADNLERLSKDFKTVKPYFITCVPKTLERMYEYLEEERQQKNKIKRWMVKWAMQVGEQFKSEKRSGMVYNIKLLIARLLVLNAWKRALSSKIKFMIVGAAALRPEIARLFSAAGVTTLSGYGMTEASPFIATNRPDLKKFGSVGLPVPGVEIKLEDINENGEGEILVRGPNITKGYFKRPESNAEAFTSDGWFKTGDIGKLINKRYLAITGRKKDIFKTSSGIYIVPQELEQLLVTSEYISQSFIFGFNKPFVGAVLVPHFKLLKSWCDEMGIHWTSPTYMVHNIKVIQKFKDEVDLLNDSLPNYKKIQKFILSEIEWTPDNGMLTASLKMIRGKLVEKYNAEIEKLYL